ncbi:MAG: glycosyltransferase family 39 protein [Candidatus Polarisedimenticolia bacterium]
MGQAPAIHAGRSVLTILLMFLAAAALLRLCALDRLPVAHYRDVALTATDALRAASGAPRLHYTYDEGLYANLLGAAFAVAGPSDAMVRLPGAIFGLLTIWGVFRLGRALGMERAGLFGAGLLAVSWWHLVLSRSGFRAVLLVCLLAHALALFAESLARGAPRRAFASGALFGLGVHVYPAIRFAPLILPFFLASLWRRAPGERGTLKRQAGWFAAAASLAALPMLADYLRNPEHFTMPHRIVSVFSPKLEPGEASRGLLENAGRVLMMLHLRGDDNPRHNLPSAPLMDPLSGLLLIVGGAALARGVRDPMVPRGVSVGATTLAEALPAAAGPLLCGWIGSMLLLPNLLSVEGVPHGLRSSGAIPALWLLAGQGLAVAEARLARRTGAGAALAACLTSILLLGMATGWLYFRHWGRDPIVALEHDAPLRAAAHVLRQAPPDVARFVLANGESFTAYGHPVETQVFLFEMRDRPPVILGPKDAPRLVLQGGRALIAFERRDERALVILKRLNPGATVSELAAPGLIPESPVYAVGGP